MCTMSHNYPQKKTTRRRQKKWGLTDVEPEDEFHRQVEEVDLLDVGYHIETVLHGDQAS